MALNIIKNYLKNNRCYQKAEKRTAIGIQLHTIGTGQGTAQSVADYWNQSAVSACVTYIVDCDTPGKVLQCLPEDYYTWADAGYGNRNLITFEICESDYMKYGGGADYKVTDQAKFKADILRGYSTAVLLCADICKRYGWNPTAKLSSGLYLISSHDEGRRAGLSSAHVDPTHVWNPLGLTMDQFRKDVALAMTGTVIDQPATEPLYRVRKSWTDVSSQLFAGTLEGAKRACLPGYSVYDESGKQVYTVQAAETGFQAADLKGLSEAERIARIARLYQDCMRKTGLLASVGIAQFCLESGYATTDLAQFANNLHGMKCNLSGNDWPGSVWDGKSKYTKKTAEQDANGNVYYVTADFRKYACAEDSIADRAAYFAGAMNGSQKRYPGLTGERDYRKAIQIIKDGGYATDINYVSKLCSLVERWNLTQYDIALPDAPAESKSSILDQCAKFQKQLKADIADGKRWEYHNPGKYLEEQWDNAIKKQKRACNCALLARWALKEAGLIPQNTGIFYGKLGGTISWGAGTKAAVTKVCELIHVGNKTVKQLIASGILRPGDIVTYVDLQHTNIYAGNGKWYDAGHAYCSGSGEGATFKSWYGDGKYDGQKVGYIIRPKKSATVTPEPDPDPKPGAKQYVVQAGSFMSKANAEKLFRKIKKAGFDVFVKKQEGEWKVQCGVFGVKKNAEDLKNKLKKAGFDAIIK